MEPSAKKKTRTRKKKKPALSKNQKATRRQRQAAGKKHWPWRTVVLYGPSGVGKTSVACTAPNVMVMDSNQGLLSVENKPGFDKVASRPIFSNDDLEKAYDHFTGTRSPSWKGKYETISFDHIDDIQQIVLMELTETAAEKDDRRLGDDPAQREWGVMANRLIRHIRRFKSLPCHKILICSVGTDQMSGQAIPNMSGQMREKLPYFADLIFYMGYGKGGKRFIQLQPSSKYLCKCRAWWMSDVKRLAVPEDDTNFMTDLLNRIAAGPTETDRT